MAWFVKCRGPDGKITSTLKDDFERAFELRNEFMSKGKGNYAWMEDMKGNLAGYTVVKGAAERR